MDVGSLYQSKLTTPDRRWRHPFRSKLSMGMAMAEPPALLKALADRAAAGQIEDLKVYYFEATSIAGETILRYELNDRIRPYCMFITATERALIKRGVEDGGRKVINYVPNNFHQAPRLLIDEIGIDTFVCTVSPMDRHGYFSFGTGNDYSTKVARAAKRLIVEVNENMPRVNGAGAELHVSEVDAIVENHVPLLELPIRGAAPEDEVIGRTIAGLVPDGACLQMGVGALPNLVCAELKDRNDLGIHTEALNPGLVDLVDAGVVTNRRKAIDRGKTVFTFAMGQKAMYDFLNDNPAVESRTGRLRQRSARHRAERQCHLDQRHDPDRPDRRLQLRAHARSPVQRLRRPARLRARRLCVQGRKVDHRLPVDRGQGQGLAHRGAARRAGHDAAHRHALRRHRVRSGESQGAVVDGARQRR